MTCSKIGLLNGCCDNVEIRQSYLGALLGQQGLCLASYRIKPTSQSDLVNHKAHLLCSRRGRERTADRKVDFGIVSPALDFDARRGLTLCRHSLGRCEVSHRCAGRKQGNSHASEDQ